MRNIIGIRFTWSPYVNRYKLSVLVYDDDIKNTRQFVDGYYTSSELHDFFVSNRVYSDNESGMISKFIETLSFFEFNGVTFSMKIRHSKISITGIEFAELQDLVKKKGGDICLSI